MPSSSTKTSPCWYGFIVPASTLRYGSILRIVTGIPRALRRRPSEEVVIPFPRPEITPPLTTITFTKSPGACNGPFA